MSVLTAGKEQRSGIDIDAKIGNREKHGEQKISWLSTRFLHTSPFCPTYIASQSSIMQSALRRAILCPRLPVAPSTSRVSLAHRVLRAGSLPIRTIVSEYTRISLSVRPKFDRLCCFTANRYTQDHELVKFDEETGVGIVSITEHAQKVLGDVVFVELPAIGAEFTQGGQSDAILGGICCRCSLRSEMSIQTKLEP